MRHITAALAFLWLAFVARGLWYSALMPAWEGYDEPFHFAALQNVASGHGMPQADTLVSLEVQNSLHLLPVPWELQFQSIPQPLTTHDDFWKLPPAERKQRVDAVRALAPEQGSQPATERIQNYESQQAPLYYWAAGIPMGWMSGQPLLSQLYLLRMLNVLLASAVVLLAWWIARRVLRSDRQAIGVVAIIVLLPELMINLARVGNESLALICYALLLVAALQVAQQPRSWRWWILLGIALGVGLLTKAYFLTAIPAVIVLAGISFWRAREGDAGKSAILAVAVRLCAALAVTLAIAGAWYARVHAATGSWSGQGDDAAMRQVSLLQKLSAIPHVNWKSGVLSVVVSHIWFGGWSFLRVPRNLYVVGVLVIVAAVAGVVIRLSRRRDAKGERRDVLVLTAFYLCFWAGLAYHVLVTFLHLGVSATTGWYLYALVAAEIVLLVWGLEALVPARVVLPALAIAVAGLDLYGMHGLLMPYYTGLTAHHGDSVSPALGATIRNLSEVFISLSETRPTWLSAPVLVSWWLGYWAATAGTVLMVGVLFRKRDDAQ
jgi:4-amino-4-deoxy-L-arabinose transferase-like glycosyltransferase